MVRYNKTVGGAGKASSAIGTEQSVAVMRGCRTLIRGGVPPDKQKLVLYGFLFFAARMD